MADLAYRVEDRSILLPYYRRHAVDPLLRFIPARLSPNAITHLGHLLNLAGVLLLLLLRPERGWPFFVAAFTVNSYVWCDNADGAHARRTQQCSALGELLDHGLDHFNGVYIAWATALSLGASHHGWVAVALLVPGAAVVSCWEQSSTGVLRLGLMTQVESAAALTLGLVLTGIFGRGLWSHTLIGPLTLGDVMIWWPCVTILFGMARNVARVAGERGAGATLSILAYFLFSGAIFAGAAAAVLSTLAAVALASALNLHVGIRMLAVRLAKTPPRLEALVLGGALAVTALVIWGVVGPAPPPGVTLVVVITVCAALGLKVVVDGWKSVALLHRIGPFV